MLPEPLPQVRRVVTANDEHGRSYLIQDGISPAILTTPGRPGYSNANIWRTIDAPTDVFAADTVIEQAGVMPPKNGTVLRVIDFPPRPADPEERRRQASASLNSLFSDAAHNSDHRQPGMHLTRTVDYAIVLNGTITAIMDSGETELHAGDILIQRATNHAWENRTHAIARVAFILIDGQ